MSEEKEKSAPRMGEVVELRQRPPLPRRKKFWMNDMEAVFGIMLLLLIFGTVNVLSSSFVLAETEYGSETFFLRRHLISLAVGGVFFLFAAWVDYHKWRRLMPLVVITMFVCLFGVLLFGEEVKGARRWIHLPFMQFQPAEGAKVVAIMLAAAFLSVLARRGRPIAGLRGLLKLIRNPQTALIVGMAILVEREPDMGTACFIIGVPLVLYIIGSRMKLSWIIGLMGIVAAGAAAAVLSQPYRMERVRMLWDPWQDATDKGYQAVQSLSTVGSGGLTGMGLGIGVSKYNYLPEAHTDFAFAIFAQENGFIFVFFAIVLYALLAFYGTRIARRAGDYFGTFLAFGVVLLVTMQAALNMLMVGGMFPVVGVPLPFISYGGSALIFTMFAMGLLVNVGRLADRENRRREQREEEREQHPVKKVRHIGLRRVK